MSEARLAAKQAFQEITGSPSVVPKPIGHVAVVGRPDLPKKREFYCLELGRYCRNEA